MRCNYQKPVEPLCQSAALHTAPTYFLDIVDDEVGPHGITVSPEREFDAEAQKSHTHLNMTAYWANTFMTNSNKKTPKDFHGYISHQVPHPISFPTFGSWD